MPPPADVEELLDRVRKSGLAPMPEVEAIAADYADAPVGGWTPPDLLERLVRDQVLTPFQADRIAAGKYKGFVLGSYVILGRVGGGGMGQVYLAEHAEMRRVVALKVLPVPLTEEPLARERFLREARAAAALDHPHIIKVFDLNREGRLLYLVMEYLAGVNLQDLVTVTGPLTPAAAVSAAAQVCRGLQHAHDRGLVHRDVKPANVLIDAAGTAKLLDLGLVRSEADCESQLTTEFGSAILGTADYVAPEQAVNSSTVDCRADVYSLGATLYYLLSGKPLFPHGGTAQKLMWQQWKTPTPLSELVPGLPPDLWPVVAKALAKRREDRYPTADAFAAALLAAVPAGATPTPPPARLVPRLPQRRWMSALAPAPGSSLAGPVSSVRLGSGATTGSIPISRLRAEYTLANTRSTLFELPPESPNSSTLNGTMRPTPPNTPIPLVRVAQAPAWAEEPPPVTPPPAPFAAPWRMLLAGLVAGAIVAGSAAWVAFKLL